MAKSYYKTIKGIRYDRALLEAVDERISSQPEGRISEKNIGEIVELSKDGGRITETELETLKYISENYNLTPKAVSWFNGKLPEIERAVDPDQFDEADQLLAQQIPEPVSYTELDLEPDPDPEPDPEPNSEPELEPDSEPDPDSEPELGQDSQSAKTQQVEEFTLEEESSGNVTHLIWGALVFVAIIVGAVLYMGAIDEIESLELKLSAVPNTQEMEQQLTALQTERSELQSKVSELNQKVSKTNSDQSQFQKGNLDEKNRLAAASSEISKLRSELQSLRGDRSTLQAKLSDLNQQLVETKNVVETEKVLEIKSEKVQIQEVLLPKQNSLTSEDSEISNLRSEVEAIGVIDFIISRSDLKVVKCEAYSCNFVSKDNSVKMQMQRATLEQHVSEGLNFLLDIEFDEKLFKSGLLVHYYNDSSNIRVYLKGADITIVTSRNDEIAYLQAWIQKVLQTCASSETSCKP